MSKKLINFVDISKSYGNNLVLDELNLYIRENEFITLLGPSGCGKTTTLRILGGFETPDKGQVIFDDVDITSLPPNKRNLNTVFQKYALFPHMSIAENIAFGLKINKKSKEYINDKIKYALKLVNLDGFENRSIDSLSGGQQQRIAIARAIVNEPKVLLLDEPLGALDLKLRQDMQYELIRLKNELGITFVYVTHDQEEAINMSDRIAVMNQGRFEQIGSPDEIYNHPKTSYVATFVGNANILKGTVEAMESDQVRVSLAGGTVLAAADGNVLQAGTPVTLAVRSENIVLDETCQKGLDAEVVEKSFAGGLLRVVLKLTDGTEVIASRYGIDASVQPGQKVTCFFEPENAVLVDLDTESGAES